MAITASLVVTGLMTDAMNGLPHFEEHGQAVAGGGSTKKNLDFHPA
jgi:hypothetical protein